MKNILFVTILLFVLQNTQAQKCDTLRIDGAPNPYGCPIIALNIYKAIYKKVSEAIFEPLSKETINYCDNCPPLQDWSHYNYNNVWSHNPFQFSNKTEYDWEAVPTGVPCNEEREPAFFLGNVKTDPLIGIYANLPSIYWEGANTLNKIYQAKQDSLTEAYQKKGLNFADMNSSLYKEYSTATLLLADEAAFYRIQSSFTLIFEYNRTSLDYPISKTDILKETAFKLDKKYTIPYTAIDNLRDVSNFQENEDMKQYNDYTKKPNITNKLGKQFESVIQLGQNIEHSRAEIPRQNADYSVFNFYVVVTGISFEKNHEVLNKIDWNKLYSFINTKKLTEKKTTANIGN